MMILTFLSCQENYITLNEAICIVRNWLATEFKGGRYQERLEMVEEIEQENMK